MCVYLLSGTFMMNIGRSIPTNIAREERESETARGAREKGTRRGGKTHFTRPMMIFRLNYARNVQLVLPCMHACVLSYKSVYSLVGRSVVTNY